MTATPTKPEELEILERALAGEDPRAVATELGVHPKRLAGWQKKWTARWGSPVAKQFHDIDRCTIYEFIAGVRG